jgi:hypothetical protein
MHRHQANSRSQPTPRVGNLNGRRRDAVSDAMPSTRSSSGTQQSNSVRSTSTNSNGQSSHQTPSPPNATRTLERPPKRPRRRTIQSTTYTEHETEPDAQAPIETVRLSDESSDEYQNSHRSGQTESDTEPDIEDDTIDSTQSELRHRSRTADRRANNRVSTVRVSTTSGSQETGLVRRTRAAGGRIIPGRSYTPPVFPSSSVGRVSSPLTNHSTTASGVRSSSPTRESSTPRHEDILPDPKSRRNTARGAEAAVVTRAKALILWYTLFENPLPRPVTLVSQVHRVWLEALNDISDAGNIGASEENIKIVSADRCTSMVPGDGRNINSERYANDTLV